VDPLLIMALALPFTGRWRKHLTAAAFAAALALSLQSNYLVAAFFFALSLVLMALSEWPAVKYPLFFLAMFDLIGIINSTNLLELFLYFELAIYASYFLIFSDRNLRAVFRYFVVNSIGSAFMLFAIAQAYFTTGSLSALPPAPMIFFVLGLLVKLGIAPFQDWLVEIYRTSALSTRIFFSSVLTEISPLALLLVVTQPSAALQSFAVFSMFLANLVALTEKSMYRMLAVFDASNLAYDLLAIAVASPASRTAALYMMFSHVIAMAFAFVALEVSGSTTMEDLKAPRGLEIPFYAAFFALSGLPPFHLFPSKLMLFTSVFSASHPLSYALLFNLILGAFASLRIFHAIKGSRDVEVPARFRAFLFGMLFFQRAARGVIVLPAKLLDCHARVDQDEVAVGQAGHRELHSLFCPAHVNQLFAGVRDHPRYCHAHFYHLHSFAGVVHRRFAYTSTQRTLICLYADYHQLCAGEAGQLGQPGTVAVAALARASQDKGPVAGEVRSV
jgi:formate hydrogenlyase subunit 3/multisubunit Na+/H+ antiporter MnhD subunit